MSSTNAVVSLPQQAQIENVLMRGDLSSLNEAQRLSYYKSVCDSVGLNMLTRPFDYITLNGKLVLYASKGCAEQLRANKRISIKIASREAIEGVYIVTAEAKDASGREDAATGAVPIAGLKGEQLANAMMKAETKAKRRVTLSICGLNMLDDTEVESLPPSATSAAHASIEDESGLVEPTKYLIPFGQWKNRSLEEVYKNAGPEKMASYLTYLEDSAKKKGQALSSPVVEFIERVEDFLGAMEAQKDDAGL